MLPSSYQNFIALSRYARWLDTENRRETWDETVDRYVAFVVKKVPQLPQGDVELIRGSIKALDVMPSMRVLMTAGVALERDNTAAFNCAYTPVDSLRAFDEAMFILLCGTGVGFSVERQYVNMLPTVPENFRNLPFPIVVADSKEGWAIALRTHFEMLFDGWVTTFDVSNVRPSGARLKTFGGRASGPAPLVSLFNFVTAKVKGAAGRKLSSVEVHDIMCKIGEIVVVGGVRRSAMISLSNLSDDRMRHAKSGQWWQTNPERALSNNSVAYTEKPDCETFMREWLSLVESKSGERGIFNRTAAILQAAKNGRRKTSVEFGTNPCSEIILRPKQFCNLTEVVIRSDDTVSDLINKVKVATILGTIQATFTYFPYLSEEWHQNTVEESLLGVSLTGIMDNPMTANPMPELLEGLRDIAVSTNLEYAKLFGIPQATAVTCVKPSGTVSQLVDSASGIHARHSEFYIRTVRGDNKDPLTLYLKDAGVPSEPCVMKPETTTVFSFPQAAPKGSVTRKDLTAIQQLETWLLYQRHWCEHKPSVTITVRDAEWMEVGAFVYRHFDEMSGVSFLPYADHTYQQAPYQECSLEDYEAALAKMPAVIDWTDLRFYETEDNTTGSQTLACSSGSCEIVDIT
jgi:ribonucleoside-diphosphate reductase alpha chain